MPFVQYVTAHSVPAGLSERLAAEVADALGLPGDAVIAQRLAALDGVGVTAVVRGRLRDPEAMRAAVGRAGALLAACLELDPDFVFVSWPDPGVLG
ncbi:hypothetical protein Aph01nite_67890 [Acrocarpospora phusangensis]|uniref:Uncharacterized protein n=1 Tax=Acrocarpospora phusangensis TaxID=1070424 RepID=A0A919QI72_9ACTN|nr:hypothetical protein [Acrocarpospora phusangensis]GIH28479.1 hypothetical protein Aph01nite_67890 [Acrocarpospora phusangensis]